MTMVIENTGRQTLLYPLTGSGAVTVLAGDGKGIATIESITWCAKSAADLSLWLTDGTNTAYHMSEEAKTANTHETISTWHPTLVNSDWELMAQASSGDAIDLIIVYAKSTQNR